MPLTNFVPLPWRIIDFSGDLTLAPVQAFAYLRSEDDGGTQDVTLQPQSLVPLQKGTQVTFKQLGTSTLSLVAGMGVTIQSRGGFLQAADQFSVFSIVLEDADNDIWSAFGDLA